MHLHRNGTLIRHFCSLRSAARERESEKEIHQVVCTYCFFCSVLVSLQFKAVLFVSAPFIVASTHASRFSPYADFQIGISKLLARTRLASSQCTFFSRTISLSRTIRYTPHRLNEAINLVIVDSVAIKQQTEMYTHALNRSDFFFILLRTTDA